MTTRMRFIGTDGSMGLRKGEFYDVDLSPAPPNMRAGRSRPALIATIFVPGKRAQPCPYSSSNAFFKNWITATG